MLEKRSNHDATRTEVQIFKNQMAHDCILLRRRTLYPTELQRHFYNETIISDFSLAGKKLYNIVIHTLCG